MIESWFWRQELRADVAWLRRNRTFRRWSEKKVVLYERRLVLVAFQIRTLPERPTKVGHRTRNSRLKGRHAAAYRFSGSPWVFHHVTTQRHHKQGARLASCLHPFQNSASRATLPAGIRLYDLRHTRLTLWAATQSLAVVQKAAGHASIKTTMGYVHLQDEDLNALVVSPPIGKPNEKTG